MSRDGMTREELLDEKQIYEMVQLIKSLPVDLKDDYLAYLHTLLNKQAPAPENPLAKLGDSEEIPL